MVKKIPKLKYSNAGQLSLSKKIIFFKFRNIGVLSPESFCKISFDIVFMIVLVLNIFYLPV
jgi:hypothetical protein